MIVDKGEAVPPVRVCSFQDFLLDVPGRGHIKRSLEQEKKTECCVVKYNSADQLTPAELIQKNSFNEL